MKGQLFSIDFMIGLSIFLITMSLVFYLVMIKPAASNLSIQAKTNQIAEFLVTSKLGTENVLVCDEIYSLSIEPYADILKDTDARPYDISVLFLNNTNICLGRQTTIGATPSTYTTVVSTVRIVNVDGNEMQMVVKLYD